MTQQEQTTGLECIKTEIRKYYDLCFKALYEEHDEEKGKLIFECVKRFEMIQNDLELLEEIKEKFKENKEINALFKKYDDMKSIIETAKLPRGIHVGDIVRLKAKTWIDKKAKNTTGVIIQITDSNEDYIEEFGKGVELSNVSSFEVIIENEDGPVTYWLEEIIEILVSATNYCNVKQTRKE